MDIKQHFFAYLHSPEETMKQYETTPEGLNHQERENRLALYGSNILTNKHRIPGWVKFLEQFKDLMIVLLIASAGIARWLGDMRTTIIL